MSSEVAIRVEGLSKRYEIYDAPRDRLKQFVLPRLQRLFGRSPRQYFQEFWALKDVSFEVRKGETVGIIGRNGSGKSTLLQMICGTLRPTSGSIQTTGRIAALLELGSGFNPEFTGRENVYLNAAVLGLSREETDSRYDDIVAFADIGQFVEQPVKTYSSGMLVRLAFAVQATVDPDILIVDEALAVGDEKFQRKCFARLEHLKSGGTSIIFVSHSGPQVVELCDRAVLLDHGVRLMCTTPMEAVRAYQNLIYAPQDEQNRLVREYLAADLGGSYVLYQSKETLSKLATEISGNSFDPGLVPETTSVYPTQGAEIQTIEIVDAEGRVVNVLQAGSDYQFVISGRFLSSVEGVYFGIHIRSISGMIITGQRYPEEGTYVERFREGDNFRVVFNFKMLLLPGVYFVGSGIWSSGEPNCCHRILDMLMFRINQGQKTISFGYVDASVKEPYLELV